ncbi:MAG: hypothetical protein A2Z44_11295 [Betaproteobacteria bacterium RBG_19FT_COMBO_58_11]|nr:MAG: hypothetical protein A2Z44_11295 [Betaproteobacteria bacterium RBG_19FT_COMBO_58_11]
MYQKMGISDCVASSSEAYVNIALRLGNDAAFRQTIKNNILAKKSVLFEDENVISEFSRFFEEVVAGRSAATIS